MYKLIQTVDNKIIAKGWRDIIDTLKTWADLHFYKNGRIRVRNDAICAKTFTMHNINAALEYVGGIWASPQGVRAIFEIIK